MRYRVIVQEFEPAGLMTGPSINIFEVVVDDKPNLNSVLFSAYSGKPINQEEPEMYPHPITRERFPVK